MIELRFHREVYHGPAVDEAMKVFDKFATFERREDPSHWVLGITAKKPSREPAIAGELANYALGLTIKHGGP